MRRATRRRVRLFLWFVVAGSLIGTAYGSLLCRMFRGTALIGGTVGTIDGAAITACDIGLLEAPRAAGVCVL